MEDFGFTYDVEEARRMKQAGLLVLFGLGAGVALSMVWQIWKEMKKRNGL